MPDGLRIGRFSLKNTLRWLTYVFSQNRGLLAVRVGRFGKAGAPQRLTNGLCAVIDRIALSAHSFGPSVVLCNGRTTVVTASWSESKLLRTTAPA